MRDREPDPKETLELLDKLVSLKLLEDSTFRRMHHLGDSLSGFRSYCQKIKSFRRDGANRRMHEKLRKILHAHKGQRGSDWR
jgi:hypothetical protein